MAVELDHIILPVADVARSVRFYHEILGFGYEPVALLRVASTLVLQLIQKPPETSQHLAFSMSRRELDETVERLKSADVAYGDNFDTVGAMNGPGRSSGSRKDGASIYFRDPDQHMLEAICYDAA